MLGLGSIRQAAKVGGLAPLYFTLMSTVALVIGLVVGNIIQPGAALQLTEAAETAGQKAWSGEAASTTDFLLGIIPTTLVSFILDGTAIYLTMASIFIADALGKPLALGEQISLLLFMILAVLAGGLGSHRPDLVDGVGLIVGMLDDDDQEAPEPGGGAPPTPVTGESNRRWTRRTPARSDISWHPPAAHGGDAPA